MSDRYHLTIYIPDPDNFENTPYVASRPYLQSGRVAEAHGYLPVVWMFRIIELDLFQSQFTSDREEILNSALGCFYGCVYVCVALPAFLC